MAERAEEFRQRAVPGESRDTFQRRFELMSIQRNLKALGTFGYMGTVRGSQRLPALHPAHAARARAATWSATRSCPACTGRWRATSRSWR